MVQPSVLRWARTIKAKSSSAHVPRVVLFAILYKRCSYITKQVQRQAMSNFSARPSYFVVSGGIDPITETINRQAR